MHELEIEIKAPCKDIAAVQKKLESIGAVFVKAEKESDCYFNHPGKDFKETDEALRIRTLDNASVLTYKGPKISMRSKARVEKEVEVLEGHITREILLLLGFTETGNVVKNRRYYRLNDVFICLDDVENLGTFVELEKQGFHTEEIEDELFRLAEELNLDSFERRSYLELVLAL